MNAKILRVENGYKLNCLTATGLAPRESQALLLVAQGHSYKSAAKAMGCGVKTIAGRIQNLFYKLKANNSRQMIANAFQLGHLVADK
jgi:DNA-binding CsgD family transcriptional regulator